jgi:hypothetical protein
MVKPTTEAYVIAVGKRRLRRNLLCPVGKRLDTKRNRSVISAVSKVYILVK